MLAAPAVVLFLAHGFYGAFLPLPALCLSASGAALLLLALSHREARQDLAQLSGLWPITLLFGAVMAVGFWSLTPTMPGGAHPLWAWAGQSAGAATTDRSGTLIELIKLLGLACFFCLGCLMGARSEQARRALTAILTVGGVWAFLSLVRFLTFSEPLAGNRLAGGFYTSNSAATVLGMLLVISVAWALRQWRKSSRLRPADRAAALAPAGAAVMLFAACLLLTASRAAIGATGLALVVVMVWDGLQAGRLRPLRAALAAVVAAIGLALYAAARTTFLSRFDTVGADAEVRKTLLDVHWQAFLDSPLTGHGLGSFTWINNQLTTADTYQTLSATIVLHNAPVQWLEEAGLIGAVPMFMLIAAILGLTLANTIKRRSNRLLLMSVAASSVVVLLHSLADVSLQTPSVAGFWSLLLGLGFAASQASTRR